MTVIIQQTSEKITNVNNQTAEKSENVNKILSKNEEKSTRSKRHLPSYNAHTAQNWRVRGFSKRFRELTLDTQKLIRDFSAGIPHRIILFILSEADENKQYGRLTSGSFNYIWGARVTFDQISERLKICRRVVTKWMGELRAKGVVKMGRVHGGACYYVDDPRMRLTRDERRRLNEIIANKGHKSPEESADGLAPEMPPPRLFPRILEQFEGLPVTPMQATIATYIYQKCFEKLQRYDPSHYVDHYFGVLIDYPAYSIKFHLSQRSLQRHVNHLVELGILLRRKRKLFGAARYAYTVNASQLDMGRCFWDNNGLNPEEYE